MAAFGFISRMFGRFGAERVGFDVERTGVSFTTKVADVMQALPTATASSPTTLWQDALHGQPSPAEPFTLLVFIPDPDGALTNDQDIELELAYTDASGSVTLRVFRVTRTMPFILSHASGGATIDEADDDTSFCKRVRARNGNATTETVRLLLLKA